MISVAFPNELRNPVKSALIPTVAFPKFFIKLIIPFKIKSPARAPTIAIIPPLTGPYFSIILLKKSITGWQNSLNFTSHSGISTFSKSSVGIAIPPLAPVSDVSCNTVCSSKPVDCKSFFILDVLFCASIKFLALLLLNNDTLNQAFAK